MFKVTVNQKEIGTEKTFTAPVMGYMYKDLFPSLWVLCNGEGVDNRIARVVESLPGQVVLEFIDE